MSKPIPWTPKRMWEHWQESVPWIFYLGMSLPFYKNWSECDFVKNMEPKSPTFLKSLDLVFHCWECAIAIIFLRVFVFPFTPKTKHHLGYYKGFWDNLIN